MKFVTTVFVPSGEELTIAKTILPASIKTFLTFLASLKDANHETPTCGGLVSSDAYTNSYLGGRAEGAAHKAQSMSLPLGWRVSVASWLCCVGLGWKASCAHAASCACSTRCACATRCVCALGLCLCSLGCGLFLTLIFMEFLSFHSRVRPLKWPFSLLPPCLFARALPAVKYPALLYCPPSLTFLSHRSLTPVVVTCLAEL